MNIRKSILAAIAAIGSTLTGCSSTTLPPIQPVANVNLQRFMGDWYVIACIPTFIETKAYNAVESYRLDSDGTIDTTFTFNEGSLTGPVKRYNPRGFVVPNSGNGLWGMQFIWPFKGEYIIAYLDDDYRATIIARNARDYVWIMARSPRLSGDDYQALVARVGRMGYSTDSLRMVPHN